MNKTPKTTTKGAALPVKHNKTRISPRMREAITMRVETGMHIADICEIVGMNPANWYKCMKRPVVAQALEDEMTQYINGTERLRGKHQRRAIEVAAQIMETSKDERVRLKAVELLKGEAPSGPSVSVQINDNRRGYEYARPGQRVVEIQGQIVPDSRASDSQSDDGDG